MPARGRRVLHHRDLAAAGASRAGSGAELRGDSWAAPTRRTARRVGRSAGRRGGSRRLGAAAPPPPASVPRQPPDQRPGPAAPAARREQPRRQRAASRHAGTTPPARRRRRRGRPLRPRRRGRGRSRWSPSRCRGGAARPRSGRSPSAPGRPSRSRGRRRRGRGRSRAASGSPASAAAAERRRHQRQPGQRVALVATAAGDPPAGEVGGDRDADHHRDQQQAGLGRARAGRRLQVDRREDGDREEAAVVRKRASARDRHRRQAQQVERNGRIGGPALAARPAPAAAPTVRAARPTIWRRVPGEAQPPQMQTSISAQVAAASSARAGDVERARGPLARHRREAQPQAGQRGQAERQVDVEDPAPADLFEEQAAEQRPGDGGEGEDGGDVALVAARSRGETRSPTAAIASVIRPPAAAPWTARAGDQLRESSRRRRSPRRRGRAPARPRAAACARAGRRACPRRGRRGRGDDVGGDHPGDVVEVPRSLAIVGSAVARIVWSSTRGEHRQDDRDEGRRPRAVGGGGVGRDERVGEGASRSSVRIGRVAKNLESP